MAFCLQSAAEDCANPRIIVDDEHAGHLRPVPSGLLSRSVPGSAIPIAGRSGPNDPRWSPEEASAVGPLQVACKFGASSIRVLVHTASLRGCYPALWKRLACGHTSAMWGRWISRTCTWSLQVERRVTQAQGHRAAITPSHDGEITCRHGVML
jgi:hypothetical protein